MDINVTVTIYSSCLGTLYKKIAQIFFPKRLILGEISKSNSVLLNFSYRTYFVRLREKLQVFVITLLFTRTQWVPLTRQQINSTLDVFHSAAAAVSRASSLWTADIHIIGIPTTLVILGLWEKPTYTLKMAWDQPRLSQCTLILCQGLLGWTWELLDCVVHFLKAFRRIRISILKKEKNPLQWKFSSLTLWANMHKLCICSL